MSPAEGTVVDRGLQTERTALAWSRNALSFAGVGVLLLHSVSAAHHPARAVPGVLALALGIGAYLMARIRYRAAVRAVRTNGSVAPSAAVVAGLALLTVVLGVLSAAAIVARA